MEVFSVNDLVKKASQHIDDGEFDQAIPLLEEAYSWSFNDADKNKLLALMSTCYRVTNQPQKALELFEKAKALGLNLRPDFLTSVGAAYLDLGDMENAKSLAGQAEARYTAYYRPIPEDLTVLKNRIEKVK